MIMGVDPRTAVQQQRGHRQNHQRCVPASLRATSCWAIRAWSGIAKANLYPSIRLGAKFGFESYLSGEFADWGSRTWSVGPSLNLPSFDHGRRTATVQLRELQQQEAAVNYQKTVLKAWQEVDDALAAYSAEQRQALELKTRSDAASDAYQLVQARYDGGATDYTAVLDSQRSYLQARRDLTANQGRLAARFITVNKVLGNGPE